jgi:ATP-binding cassette subfamily B protein
MNMKGSIVSKVKKIGSGLDLGETLKLVWSLSGGLMVGVVLLILLETALFLGSLYALKGLIDLIANQQYAEPGGTTLIIRQIIGAGILAVLHNGLKSITVYYTEKQAAFVAEHMNDRIHATALHMDLAFYESPSYFDLLQRAKEAGADRPNAVLISLLDTLKNSLSLLAIASVMVGIDWILLPLLILFVFPTLLVRIVYSEKLHALRVQNTGLERKSDYLSQLITTEGPAKEIRIYQLGAFLKEQYLHIRYALLKQRLQIASKRTNNEVVSHLLASAGFFACIYYMTLGAIEGNVGAGDIAIFMIVFPQVFHLLQGIATGISVIYQNNIYVQSIFELFSLENKTKESLSKDLPAVQLPAKSIELSGIHFTYPNATSKTLENIHLHLPYGKIVGLVGMNGAGKSTLIKVLTGLYKPDQGKVFWNGQSIQSFDPFSYRSQFGVVFQDFTRFHFTVADNVRFGAIHQETFEEKNIQSALHRTGADGFVDHFEQGMYTMMGRQFEDGKEVSIGQWQKLATARALFNEGSYVILDEASSALDTHAEWELFGSIREKINGRGALLISHRFSSIRQADYIYVLSEGKMIEEGTPTELIEQKGAYYELFKDEFVSQPYG